MADDELKGGPALLAAALKEHGVRQMKLEDELDVARGLVSRWLSGDRKPGLAEVMYLERRFGIPLRAWLSEEEIAAIDGVDARVSATG